MKSSIRSVSLAIAAVVAVVMPLIGSDYAVSFSIQLLIFLVLAYPGI